MPSTLEQVDRLEAALESAKRKLRVVTVGMGVLGWTAAAATWLLMFVILDHSLGQGVPDGARALTSGVFVIASGLWLALAAVLPAVRRVSDLYVARLIEHAHPEFRNTLVDAIQLRGRSDLPGSVLAAVVSRAAGEVAQIRPHHCVPVGGLRRLAVTNAVVLVVCGVYVLLAPKAVGPSLRRAVGLAAPAPTLTRIVEVSPADGTSVLRGQPISFTAQFEGQHPREAFVRFRPVDDAAWQSAQQLALTPPEGSRPARQPWQATKAGQDLQESVIWQVVAGDAVSEERQLEVRPVPGIANIRVGYEYPRYTGMAPTTQPGGEIDAPVGTQVTIEATANVPAFGPLLILGQPPNEKRQVLAQPEEADPTRITARLTVTGDDTYSLHFRDAQREPNRHAIRHAIRARVDHRPIVRIDSPEPRVQVEPTGQVTVAGRVEDDYGVTRSVLAYRLAGRQETRQLALDTSARDGGREAALSRTIPVHELGGRPGDVIEWWVSAWDNREDLTGRADHQRADSEVRHLEIREPASSEEPAPQMADEEPSSSPASQEAAPAELADAGNTEPSQPEEMPPETASAAPPSAEEPASQLADNEPSDQPTLREDSPTAAAQGGSADPTAPRRFARIYDRELAALVLYLLNEENGPSNESADEPQAAHEGERESASLAEGQVDAATPGTGTEGEAQPADAAAQIGEDSSPSAEPAGSASAMPGEAAAETATAGENASTESSTPDTTEPSEAGQRGETAAPSAASEMPRDDSGSAANQAGMPTGEAETPTQQADAAGPAESNDHAASSSDGEGPSGQSSSAGSANDPTDGPAGQPGDAQSGPRGAPGTGGQPSPHELAEGPQPEPPPDDIPAPDSPPSQSDDPLMASDQVAGLIDALERRLRQDDVDPAMLDALDWDVPRARQFIEEYRRMEEGLQPQVASTPVPSRVLETPARGPDGRRDSETESDDVLRAAGPGEAGTQGRDAGEQPADGTRELLEATQQRVLPPYQDLLDAYYRSISTQPSSR